MWLNKLEESSLVEDFQFQTDQGTILSCRKNLGHNFAEAGRIVNHRTSRVLPSVIRGISVHRKLGGRK